MDYSDWVTLATVCEGAGSLPAVQYTVQWRPTLYWAIHWACNGITALTVMSVCVCALGRFDSLVSVPGDGVCAE